MVTILLEKILSLLEGWAGSFASFIIDLMAKLNLIETETANLPDIKTNTDNISTNTDSMTATLTNIKTDTGVISGKVNTIDSNTTIIKNNINTISTNVGTASAFCEDTANNTLEIVDKITTIASDTTQLRTNSNSISADVSEIKNTLGLYLYNTIVTEDSEGSIANFDTDLKDYLQEAKVTIPADAGGITEAKIGYVDFNQLVKNGNFSDNSNWTGGGNVSLSVANNEITVTFTAIPTYDYQGVIQQSINTVSGHIYYSKYDIYVPKNSKVSTVWLNVKTTKDINSGWNEISGIARETTSYPYVRFGVVTAGSTNYQIGDSYIIKNCVLIDLTELFGSTIAEYLYALPDNGLNIVKQLFNKDYYPYNAGGTLVSVESVNGSYYPNASVSFGSSITDGGELDLLTGLITVNTTPPSIIPVDPVSIRTLKGLNSIWSNVGDMSVTYRETLKHYLEKQNS